MGEHTKKMILIDPRVLDSLTASKAPPVAPDPVADSVKDMDSHMKTILDNKSMNIHDKAEAYHQTLRRYLHRLDEFKKQPLGTVITQPPASALSHDPPTTTPASLPSFTEDKMATRLLDSLGTVNKKKAQLLLQHIYDHPDLAWNDHGEFVYQGQRLEKSNLIDLVNDAIRKRKSSPPPYGWQQFVSALGKTNIPLEAIGNPQRLKYIIQKQDVTSSLPSRKPSHQDELSTSMVSEETDFENTPYKRKKRKRPRRVEIPWESYER